LISIQPTIPVDIDICIVKPLEKAFYFGNIHLFNTPRNTIIIGYIDIIVNATALLGIEKVEFFINNKIKMTDFEEPYIFTWISLIPFKYIIKAIAYDNYGNWKSVEIKVWKIF